MDYTNLKTYRMQVKYVQEILYDIKINETDHLNKFNELRKLINVYESVFDTHGVLNVRCDISLLDGKIQEDKKLIKQYSDLIVHIEILCNIGGNKDTKYLDEKPKNGVKWLNTSIKDIEEEYGDLIKPKQ